LTKLSVCFLTGNTWNESPLHNLIDSHHNLLVTVFTPFFSSQVKYIYIALFTIQIVSKLLHSINQDNITVPTIQPLDRI